MALIGASLVFKGVKGKEISKKEEDNLALEIGIDSVMGAEDEPLFPGLNCSHCGSDEDTYYGEPETHTPDGIVLNPNHVEAKLHIWCDSCGEASPIEDYDAESFEAEA